MLREGGPLHRLKRALMCRALGAKMEHHLGYTKGHSYGRGIGHSHNCMRHAFGRQVVGQNGDDKGDLNRLCRSVPKELRIDDQSTDLDANSEQVLCGLVQVVDGFAPIRNRMSGGRPRQRKPGPHHARVIVAAAKTSSVFLRESYLVQRDKGLLPRPGARKEASV